MKRKVTFAIIISSIGIVNTSFADNVYEYRDKNGNLTFTNKPTKDSKKVNLPPISVYSSPMTNSYSSRNIPTLKNGNNSNIKTIYPKNMATNSYQYKGTNEAGRRQVLSAELASEKLALVDSQQALTEATKVKLASEKNNNADYQKRIQALQDSVTEHQKNIEILNKQLGTN